MIKQPVAKMWYFPSSSGNKTYETLQYEDGTTSCNCLGWCRRVASDGTRTCKHTRQVESGSAGVPALDYTAGKVSNIQGASSVTSTKKTVAKPAPVQEPEPAPKKAIPTVRHIQWD